MVNGPNVTIRIIIIVFSGSEVQEANPWRAYKLCSWLSHRCLGRVQPSTSSRGTCGSCGRFWARINKWAIGSLDSERGLTSGQSEVWFWLLYLDKGEGNSEILEGGKEKWNIWSWWWINSVIFEGGDKVVKYLHYIMSYISLLLIICHFLVSYFWYNSGLTACAPIFCTLPNVQF